MQREAFAHARYLLFASAARKQGDVGLASMYGGIAAVELHEHFTELAELTERQEENFEVEWKYPQFADQARAAGEVAVAGRRSRTSSASPSSTKRPLGARSSSPSRVGIRRTAESVSRVFADASPVDLVHPDGMTDRQTQRAELDDLRSEWRRALLAARESLRAEEGFLPEEELAAHDRHLRGEYKAAAAELRQFARDEGLPMELAEPFLARGIARRALGLPKGVRACVFELEDVLVGSSALHREAWQHTLNELLAARSETRYGRLVAPFDPRTDYPEHIEGRPRLEGVRGFLASRGIRLPEGQPGDPPGVESVHGVANRKNEWLGRLLEQRGVGAFDGVRHYLELSHDARISCAAVSASAHTAEMLEASGLSELFEASIDADDIVPEQRQSRPAADRLRVACQTLCVDPVGAAAFENSTDGVAAARAAGFAWIVAIDPAGDPDKLRQLERAGAHVVARGLGELLGR
jgi:beta-phosphoglucomutase-like phosphatase (HAD superfamily)